MQAAKVNPIIARIVEMMQVGPVSNLVVLHVLMLLEYDRARQERAQGRAELMAVAQAQPRPAPEQMPAEALTVFDEPAANGASTASPFGVAAAA